MTSTFHVSMELKGQRAGAERVHYKNDGERFPEGHPNTVKLNVDTPYTFTVHFRPARVLTHWMVRGDKVEFERVMPSKAEEDVSIYKADWSSTGLTVTKRADRFSLGMELEIDPGLVMKTTLQIKFYPAQETTHTNWGPEVHSLEYNCAVSEGSMCADIVNEKII